MFYTYVLVTASVPRRTYVGLCVEGHPEKRLSEHNAGLQKATRDMRPWELLAYFAWPTKGQAVSFEQYLKSGNGRAFMTKWLFPKTK